MILDFLSGIVGTIDTTSQSGQVLFVCSCAIATVLVVSLIKVVYNLLNFNRK